MQLPEATDASSEAYKAGYKTIADISRARIQKVIQNFRKSRTEKLPLEGSERQHLGFKAYKLAPSNFNIWRADVEGEEALIRQLELHTQAEKEASLPEAMLYELLLKSGLPLTTPVEALPVAGSSATLYKVANGALALCFDTHNSGITDAILALHPQKAVLLNSSFAKDEDLTNFKLQLKDAGIDLTIV